MSRLTSAQVRSRLCTALVLAVLASVSPRPADAGILGWVGGVDGTLIHTTNGGSTWSSQNPGTGENIMGLTFIGPSNGWAVGPGGTIIHTTNGGSSWSSQVSGVSVELNGIWFTDASTGWASGANGTILNTTNGGSTWSSQPIPGSLVNERLFDVAFADANTGWAVGTSGTILQTSNGGSTWSRQESGTPSNLEAVAIIPEPSTALLLVSGLVGLAMRRRHLN